MAAAAEKPVRVTPSIEENLAWEAQWAPRAAIAAIIAGLCTIGGTVVSGIASRDAPQVTLFQGLRDIGNPTSQNGLRAPLVKFFNDHVGLLTLGTVLTALAAPLTALALVYLFRAARARNPQLGQAALIAVAIGGVATFVGYIVAQVALDISVSDFVSSANHSTPAAHDALQPSAVLTASLVRFIGSVALGLGFVMIALNAMRVGLLTRFMGVLGIMAGVFLAFPFFSIPIVQAFWLVAAGILFLGKLPNMPPAWETGRAEPWPTRQEMLEAQGKLPAQRGGRASAPPPASSTPPPADPLGNGPERPQHPRSKKKKRRR